MELEHFFRDAIHISDQALLDQVADQAQMVHIKKGQLLIRQGEGQTQVYFLIKGILRGYFLDAKGRDITDCFVFVCGAPAMPGFELGESAPINIEAITDSDLVSLPLSLIQELLDHNDDAVRLYAQLVLDSAKRHWEIKTVLYQYTATQKYQWFLQAYPELICHVSGRHIASFLGMTPVTLSRLKRTLHEQARKS